MPSSDEMLKMLGLEPWEVYMGHDRTAAEVLIVGGEIRKNKFIELVSVIDQQSSGATIDWQANRLVVVSDEYDDLVGAVAFLSDLEQPFDYAKLPAEDYEGGLVTRYRDHYDQPRRYIFSEMGVLVETTALEAAIKSSSSYDSLVKKLSSLMGPGEQDALPPLVVIDNYRS